MIRQILEKCHEYQIELHHLFIDYKQAYDSINRRRMVEVMTEFGIPEKLVKLTKMTLEGTRSKVKAEGGYTEDFEIKRGLRQGDVLSTVLFNLALEKAVRQLPIHPGGTIFNRMLQCLAYADDIVLVSRRKAELEEGYLRLQEAAGSLGLEVNQEKTKYMVTSNAMRAERAGMVELGNKRYEQVSRFTYLGSLVTENNVMAEEIKERIACGNRCYFSLQGVFKSKNISRTTKTKIYKTLVRPVLMYGSETWTMTQMEEEWLRRWERKILRRIYGGINENGVWRTRTNQELRALYQEPDIVTEIKTGRLRWAGHVQRLPETSTTKKIFTGGPGGRRRRGRPRKRWVDDLEDDLRKLGVRRWRMRAEEREDWRQICLQARALQEL